MPSTSFISRRFVLVCSEDIVVFSKSPRHHLKKVRRVLRLLYELRVTPKLRKCKLFAELTDYFGHVIRPGRLKPADYTTDDVSKLGLPTTQNIRRSLMGQHNVSCRFVPILQS